MNSRHTHRADLADALFQLCRATAMGVAWTGMTEGDLTDWERLTELADHHGLVALLYTQHTRHHRLTVPHDLVARWRDHYRAQLIRNACGMHQIRQLATACAARGTELVLLKGCAALLWLYEERGLRVLGDLDVLVPPAQAETTLELLVHLGYQPVSKAVTRKSAEEAYLAEQRRLHLPQMARDQQVPIELHLRLFRQADGTPFLPDLWSDAFSPDVKLPHLKVLSPSHSLLHGSIHYWKHLHEGFCPLKSLLDLLLIVHGHGSELDWQELWATARRWGILTEAAAVLATLNCIWSLPIPGLPEGTAPLSKDVLISGRQLLPETGAWKMSWDYLARAKQLKGLPARARYLLRALFPEPEYVRDQLNLAPDHPLIGAYFRYSCSGILRVASQFGRAPSPPRQGPTAPSQRLPRDRGAP